QDQADRLDRPDQRLTDEDRGLREYSDQTRRQRVRLHARSRHGPSHGTGATERGAGGGQTDGHHRRDEEHGGVYPGRGGRDQTDDPTYPEDRPERREDHAPR